MSAIETQRYNGLTEAEAKELFIENGPNELPGSQPKTFLHIAFEVASEPMFLLLVACGILYLILGDHEEAFMLLGFVFVIMSITLVQENKTERALEALRDLSSPRAFVIRDGIRKKIAGREVVRGDLIELLEGDRIPADAAVIENINLSVDESLLTGEAVPVRKVPCDVSQVLKMGKPGGDDTPFIFSGTLVVSGRAFAKVIETGLETELGKIGRSLASVEEQPGGLKGEVSSIVKRLAIIGASMCVLVIVVYGITRGNWVEGFLAGITLAMAVLPEELPVVLTIFLALGAWRISKKQVLTRKVPAIETLGAATVLCSDKTGTITQNKMTLISLWNKKDFYELGESKGNEIPESFHVLLEFSILASQRDPFDPMEKALKKMGERFLSKTEHIHSNWNLLKEYSLSKELLALSHVWKSPDGKAFEIAAKGSPEAIFDLCHLPSEVRIANSKAVLKMSESGLRVLGVARCTFAHDQLPNFQHDFPFKFVGLIGFEDPIRPSVPAAVEECKKAGVRVVMITGDYPGTATNIAKQAGIVSPENVITGPEIDSMSDSELAEKSRNVNVFARVVPEQKLKIVQAFKSVGEIVAMTGDGVNDAPALKAAHIGIAMGARGTDVAREASSLVLLDDDFASIVSAARLGRRIFQNIQKAIGYIFAIHIPIAGLSLIPVLLKWELILLPAHIVFLELLIDPACSIVFEAEPEEPNVMERPPRKPDAPLFGKNMVLLSILQGLGILAVCLYVFLYSTKILNFPVNECRALTFTTLIFANLMLIVVNRSWLRTAISNLLVPNAPQWFVIVGGIAFLGIVLTFPFFQSLFKFAPLHWNDLTVCFLAGGFSLLWFEIFKKFRLIPAENSVPEKNSQPN
ncbi:MAG: cation-translocating P-type ATPase [Candidatus Riflebacteria bacterium]|nr:cation-translocating P-type ATPase [Candidatus Riflebacteria bacterium]